MGIPLLVRQHLYIETAPRASFTDNGLFKIRAWIGNYCKFLRGVIALPPRPNFSGDIANPPFKLEQG